MINTDVLVETTYIGIDINVKGFGLAVFTVEKVHLEFFNMLLYKPEEFQLTNMTTIWSLSSIELMKLVKQLISSDRKTVVTIEDPTAMSSTYQKKNGTVVSAWQTASILDKLFGMLSVIVISNKYVICTPSSVIWKKRVIGKGNAKKPIIQSHMYKVIYGREGNIENHHIADAAALAYYGYLEDRYGKK